MGRADLKGSFRPLPLFPDVFPYHGCLHLVRYYIAKSTERGKSMLHAILIVLCISALFIVESELRSRRGRLVDAFSSLRCAVALLFCAVGIIFLYLKGIG